MLQNSFKLKTLILMTTYAGMPITSYFYFCAFADIKHAVKSPFAIYIQSILKSNK